MTTINCLGVPVPISEDDLQRLQDWEKQSGVALSLFATGYGLGYYAGKVAGVDAALERVEKLVTE